MMKKIAVIAGTSDATELIRILSKQAQKYQITAFTATDYGKEILQSCDCKICVGRLDATGFSEKLADFEIVIDASHPFAEEVTRTVRTVCKILDLPYLRLLRSGCADIPGIPESDRIRIVNSKEEACAMLSTMPGNILLTTGVKTLTFYEEQIPDFAVRGFARILDTPDSRKITAHSHANLIYALPPFTEQDLSEIVREHQISVIVSKDSGTRGGVDQKIWIAEKFRIFLILIRKPEESGMQMQEILDYILNCPV
ncbi:MAG: precorrin-6A/cobalt-precorrin-6A reductase [Oscillospiraceae bacterium]|nr:precorrin-6A/cobalt-precorrin-6A reductase [Oscillospiraceae bacterium]